MAVISGSSAADNLTATAPLPAYRPTGSADSILGQGGADTIDGGSGNDTLDGYRNALNADDLARDVISGGQGDDLFGLGTGDIHNGDAGNDIFKEVGTFRFAAGGQEFRNLAAGGTINGGTGQDTLKLFFNDMSRWSITEVETLRASSIRLTTEQLNGFASIGAYGDFDNPLAGDPRYPNAPTYLSAVNLTLSNAGRVDLSTRLASDATSLHVTAAKGNTTVLLADTWTGTFTYLATSVLARDASTSNVRGGGGNDSISGGMGADTLDGGAGDDTLDGYWSSGAAGDADLLRGGRGNDTFRWLTNGDVAEGGEGNDVFEVQAGGSAPPVARIDGGAGIDTLNLFGTSPTIVTNVEVLASSGLTVSATVLSGFSLLKGYFQQSQLAFFLSSGGTLDLTGRIDRPVKNLQIVGSRDAETITVGSDWTGQFTFNGSIGTVTGDTVRGGANSDSFSGGSKADRFEGNGGNDSLAGYAEADTLLGGAGHDRLDGGSGGDWLDGGADNDTIRIEGADTVRGGTGDDLLELAISNERLKPVLLDGGTGFDVLRANAIDLASTTVLGIERLEGGTITGAPAALSSFQELRPSTGSSMTLIGSAPGLINLSATTFDRVRELMVSPHATGGGVVVAPEWAGALTFRGAAGADTVSGGAGKDTVQGAGGADSLLGGGGADTLDGGAGNDTMRGGDGNDLVLLDSVGDVVDGGAGTDTVQAASGATLGSVSGVEVLQAGSVTGTTAAFSAFTSIRASGLTLSSAGTLDLTGKLALDVRSLQVTGSSGDDTFIMDALSRASLNFTGDPAGKPGGADRVRGGTAADRLAGALGNDTLDGEAGNDTLTGGDGNDLLTGGLGSDSLGGGNGFDTVSYAGSTAVTVDLTKGRSSGGAGTDNISNDIEAVEGSAQGDSIVGSAAANLLRGGDGADTLAGAAGNDTLHGGADADLFSFFRGGGADRIEGFEDGADRLSFAGFGTAFDTAAEILATAQLTTQGWTLVLPNPAGTPGATSVLLAGFGGALTTADFGTVIA